MENENEQLEALKDIRKMMRDSSKFLSLSGLSGVFAGVYALTGVCVGYRMINNYLSDGAAFDQATYNALLARIGFVCIIVLLLSILTAFILSSRKAMKSNQGLFDQTSKKLCWSMAVPLVAGGLFCIAMVQMGAAIMAGSVMLLFYGMALLNSCRYFMPEIRYLGYFELTLGLLAAFFPLLGLWFWAIGFGVLHIIYGAIMWFKYDR